MNKTDVIEYIGKWVPDDSMFRNRSKWAPLHFKTVTIVGWEVLEPGSGADIQSAVQGVSVNIFNAPLWWRKQFLFLNMDYHLRAYFNDSTRLVASSRTNAVLVQKMIYTKEYAPDRRLLYGYEITDAGPHT